MLLCVECSRIFGAAGGKGLPQWLANLRTAVTAILYQEHDEFADGTVVGPIDNLSALPAAVDKSGGVQLPEVAGHGVLPATQRVGNFASRESFRARLHKNAEHPQAGFLRERRKGFQCILNFHISEFLDIWISCQAKAFSESGRDGGLDIGCPVIRSITGAKRLGVVHRLVRDTYEIPQLGAVQRHQRDTNACRAGDLLPLDDVRL